MFKFILILCAPVLIIFILLRIHQIRQWDWLEKLMNIWDRHMQRVRHQKTVGFEAVLILTGALILIVGPRSTKSLSWGEPGKICVLADSLHWDQMEGLLRDTFQRIVRTPQKERIFTLRYASPAHWERYLHYRDLIILIAMDGEPHQAKHLLDRLIPKNLTTDSLDRVRMWVRNNVWTLDQQVVVMAGPSAAALRQALTHQGPRMYRLVEEGVMRRMERNMYHSREEKKRTARLLEEWGWALKKQGVLTVTDIHEESNMVSFRSPTPGRWLFVHWKDSQNPAILSAREVVRIRDDLGKMYFDTAAVEPRFFNSEIGTFCGRKARVTTGLWGDEHPFWGGPFKNYTFWDSLSRRIYMVDLFIYRGGKDKMPFLKELDIIAHSFTSSDIPDEWEE